MDNGQHPSVKTKLKALRPTQMTVGFVEVALKLKEWQARSAKGAKEFLRDHRFPAIRGPGGEYYIIDHHHLGLALVEAKVETVIVAVLNDYSDLAPDEFWILMDFHQWAHPYDAKGKRRDFAKMPAKLKQLPDDPYRSLVAAVRRAGEFPKDATPFSEFVWADFFRRRIPAAVLRKNPDYALARAKKLAVKPAAKHLPGWAGISKG